MISSLISVLVFATAFALTAPFIARQVSPSLAIRVLIPASAIVAVASSFALGVSAFTLVGQWPEIAEMGPWSPQTLRHDSPVPASAALVGGLLLVYAMVSATILISRRSIALVDVHRTCGRLGAPGTVVVVDSETPDAFTTPEAKGRIVVTRGMLDALSPAQRRAMLAHEASHLRHRHTWWLLAMDLASAVNPTLRPAARSMRHAVERWADEDAARSTNDRRTVAYALARAALAAHAHRHQPTHIAAKTVTAENVTPATGGDVPARVTALLVPPMRRKRPAIAALVVSVLLVGATAIASVHLQHDGEMLFARVLDAHADALHARYRALNGAGSSTIMTYLSRP